MQFSDFVVSPVNWPTRTLNTLLCVLMFPAIGAYIFLLYGLLCEYTFSLYAINVEMKSPKTAWSEVTPVRQLQPKVVLVAPERI